MSNGEQRCPLTNYGINRDTVDAIMGDIVKWLQGYNLPWHQTKYVSQYAGPMNRSVVELLFFHYDGPPGKEVGAGGELNNCKIYLYSDHMTISFVGDNTTESCALSFRHSSRWYETDFRMLHFLISYLNSFLVRIFETEPTRFGGNDEEVEAVKETINNIERALSGDGMLG